MPFLVEIIRQQNVASLAAFPAIGSDVDPTTLSGAAAAAYAAKRIDPLGEGLANPRDALKHGNVWQAPLDAASGNLAARKFAVASQYTGAGAPVGTMKVCIYIPEFQLWVGCPTAVQSITFGELDDLQLISLGGPSRAESPTGLFAFVPLVAAAIPDGTYRYAFGVDFTP